MSAVMNVFIAAGSAAAVVAVIGGFIGRQAVHGMKRAAVEVVKEEVKTLTETVEKRFDKNDKATQAAADKASSLELHLAREFGGNSGGMRQAINEMRTDLAHFHGAFDQHLMEGNK
jgi:hypothetical protein